MSRNFGLGSRNITFAGYIALQQIPSLSFSSRATMHSRWAQFSDYLRDEHDIKIMEHITKQHILEFSAYLLDQEISGPYHRNLISAINRVLEESRQDRQLWLSPTRHCFAPRASYICKSSKSVPLDTHNKILEKVPYRLSIQLELQRSIGLRFKESCLINPRAILKEVHKTGFIKVIDGTKGGRPRLVPASNDSIKHLHKAEKLQGRHWSLVPENKSYIQYSRDCYYQVSNTSTTFHQERHSYAQTRYNELLGVDCPVVLNIKHGKEHHNFIADILNLSFHEAKNLDCNVRKQIAQELGHKRVEITNAYLG